MVMCILSAVVAGCGVILAGIAAGNEYYWTASIKIYIFVHKLSSIYTEYPDIMYLDIRAKLN